MSGRQVVGSVVMQVSLYRVASDSFANHNACSRGVTVEFDCTAPVGLAHTTAVPAVLEGW
jgi:hypothetical protein